MVPEKLASYRLSRTKFRQFVVIDQIVEKLLNKLFESVSTITCVLTFYFFFVIRTLNRLACDLASLGSLFV